MANYKLNYTGDEVNYLLGIAASGGNTIGDIKLTMAQPSENWVELNGATISKIDYPALAELGDDGSASFYATGVTVQKLGDYYIRSITGQTTFTYYSTLADVLAGTNGKSVKITSTSDHKIQSMAYCGANGGFYCFGVAGGYVYTSADINGPYTSTAPKSSPALDDDVDSMVGTKYGVYCRVWDDSKEDEYAYYSLDGATWYSVTSGTLEDWQVTEDGEYAFLRIYQTATTYAYKGSTRYSYSIPATGTLTDCAYSDAEKCFYCLASSGSSGAYTGMILKSNIDIEGHGSGYTTLKTQSSLNLKASGSVFSCGDVTIISSSRLGTGGATYIVKNGVITQTIDGASYTFYTEDFIDDRANSYKIYNYSTTIDFSKMTLPTLHSDAGQYYILAR